MSGPSQPAPSRHALRSAAAAGGGVLLLLVGPLPFLIAFGQRAAAGPQRELFLALLVGALLLVLRSLRSTGPLHPARPRLGAAVLLGAWGLLAAAVLLDSPGLGTAAALVSLAAVGLRYGGLVRYRLTPAWALLWLALPLAAGLPEEVPAHLQARAARTASAVLDLLGVFHYRDGGILDLG